MKVIAKDNLDRDTVDDKLIAENLTREEARELADKRNHESDSSDWFFMAVEDNYELYVWTP